MCRYLIYGLITSAYHSLNETQTKKNTKKKKAHQPSSPDDMRGVLRSSFDPFNNSYANVKREHVGPLLVSNYFHNFFDKYVYVFS